MVFASSKHTAPSLKRTAGFVKLTSKLFVFHTFLQDLLLTAFRIFCLTDSKMTEFRIKRNAIS